MLVVHLDMLNINLKYLYIHSQRSYAWGYNEDTIFTSESCMGYSTHWWLWGYVFPGGVGYSLVNNVCVVRYSLGYRIHSDTDVLDIDREAESLL